jgi:hypothetical protein
MDSLLGCYGYAKDEKGVKGGQDCRGKHPISVLDPRVKAIKGLLLPLLNQIFYNELIRDLFSLKHGEKVRTPAFRNPEDTEILQQRQKAVVQKFCSKLTLDRYAEVFGHGSNINEAGKAPEQAPPTQKPLKLLWERMADRESILGETDLQWPSWVQHDQLLLNRGRFPMNVEGVDQNLLIKRAPRAAGPKKEARQKALWEVADALSGKKKDKRRY